MTKEINPVFTFWVENKIANERKFFVSDMRQLFQKWLLTKKIEWVEYYGCEVVVTSFITEREGLNSTFKNSQLDELVRLLKPDYKNLLSGVNPVTKEPFK